MKLKKIIFGVILIILAIQVQLRLKNKSSVESTFSNSLQALAKMRLVPGSFDPNKITKYFKDQKPPSDKTTPFTDSVFPPNSYSIDGKDANGNMIDPTNADTSSRGVRHIKDSYPS